MHIGIPSLFTLKHQYNNERGDVLNRAMGDHALF